MLKNISKLKGVATLSKKDQKSIVAGSARIACNGTPGEPVGWPQDRCFGWGIRWYNGVCYVCY